MSDILTEVCLPSQGLLYSNNINPHNQLRAPRLKDKGLGDTTRKLKLQASILDRTLVQPLGMSTYDLHTADFVYLNMRQRQLSKGAAPYKIRVRCSRPSCGKVHDIDIPLEQIEVKNLVVAPKFEFTTADKRVITYNFVTPRIMDDSKDNALAFKEQYPDTDLSLDVLETQEFLRLLISRVDGVSLPYAQKTEFIAEMLLDDIEAFLAAVSTFEFGLQFRRSFVCDCGKRVVYDLLP